MLRSGLLWMSLYQHWCAGIVSHCLELKPVLSLIGLILYRNSVWGLPKKIKKKIKGKRKNRRKTLSRFHCQECLLACWRIRTHTDTQARVAMVAFSSWICALCLLVRYLGVYSLSTLQYVRTVCLCVIARAHARTSLLSNETNLLT